ncbi:spore germination protein [Lysinibacillus agricola]|uniref:Spore germination protein n=1 Tax=Lysinibacillus agricola TaxID=2590012 RepID=A0ABX7AZ29_9BACI|nr:MULTISPECIES: spore germination protein [Lysinibacillus]KOS61813.1 spore gernimation protein [Lysinibacillus sp. FJAT-14222]QQP14103.1 spore germination protein [Lysinibacillus agricola]
MEHDLNLKSLKALFQRSADVIFQEFIFQQHKVHLITCEAMINEQLLQTVIVQRVQSLFFETSEELLEEHIQENLHIPHLQKISNKDEAITRVYKGHALLYFEDINLLYSSYIAKKPNREPKETTLELVVKGPRDDFIEDVFINIALLRKRLPTNSLSVETYELGKRSKTTVAVLYIEDVVNQKMLEQIKLQLQGIDTDIVFSGDLLMERIEQSTKVLPRHDYTGRPDFAIQALSRGRIIIIVDGVSYVIITPANSMLLFKSGEDNEYPIIVSSMERILRIVAVLISVLLPGFWLALTTHHQEQLPFILLATVVESRMGLPFPTILEILMMLFMFELFREANIHLPNVISGSISVVGGLVIGDAAIKAGVTSPAMIVVIATSSIAAFTLVNQSFVTAMSILRLIIILASAFFGLFGFFISVFFILLYTANLRVLGVPYLNMGADLDWQDIKRSLVRLSPAGYRNRPEFLNVQDKSKTSSKKK